MSISYAFFYFGFLMFMGCGIVAIVDYYREYKSGTPWILFLIGFAAWCVAYLAYMPGME